MSEHYLHKYYGMKYELNKFDCTHLIELIYKDEYDIILDFPQHTNCKNVKNAMEYIELYKNATRFSPCIVPHEGCIVLMRKTRLMHIGMYYKRGNSELVIHNLAACGVISEPLGKINVIGFYEWN